MTTPAPAAPRRVAKTPWYIWLLLAFSLTTLLGGLATCGACYYWAAAPPEPECKDSLELCRACCDKDGRVGGHIAHGNTKISGAAYQTCMCGDPK